MGSKISPVAGAFETPEAVNSALIGGDKSGLACAFSSPDALLGLSRILPSYRENTARESRHVRSLFEHQNVPFVKVWGNLARNPTVGWLNPNQNTHKI